MPMAGEGSRFKEAGYDTPKPLIKLKDKELYRHALDSINFDKWLFITKDIKFKYTFIVRKEFISDYHIDEEIKKYYPEANILYVEKTTRGALETVMLAEPYIDDDDMVLVMDCDLEFRCDRFIGYLYYEVTTSKSPLLLSFYSKDPKYSYCEQLDNDQNTLTENVVEKKQISTHALGGCYCVGLGSIFKKCAHQVIKDFEDNKLDYKELYLSLVYNYIIKETEQPVIYIDMNMHKDHYWSYGTPYDLENYNYDRNIWDV